MDNMPDQREYWRREHAGRDAFRRIYSAKPSQPVVDLVDFLVESGLRVRGMQALDVGCGIGRNSAYLAHRGFRVIGVDFVSEALEEAKNRYAMPDIHFDCWDLGQAWRLYSESIDVIIDCNATISLYAVQRKDAIREAYRVLKNRGHYLFYGVGPSPELMARYPGPEPESILFPEGRFEKRYSKGSLCDAYEDYALIDGPYSVPGNDPHVGAATSYYLWIALFQKLA